MGVYLIVFFNYEQSSNLSLNALNKTLLILYLLKTKMALLKSLHLGYMLNGQKILFMTIIMLMLDMTALPTPKLPINCLLMSAEPMRNLLMRIQVYQNALLFQGHGMACEEYSDKLQELFGDACSKN